MTVLMAPTARSCLLLLVLIGCYLGQALAFTPALQRPYSRLVTANLRRGTTASLVPLSRSESSADLHGLLLLRAAELDDEGAETESKTDRAAASIDEEATHRALLESRLRNEAASPVEEVNSNFAGEHEQARSRAHDLIAKEEGSSTAEAPEKGEIGGRGSGAFQRTLLEARLKMEAVGKAPHVSPLQEGLLSFIEEHEEMMVAEGDELLSDAPFQDALLRFIEEHEETLEQLLDDEDKDDSMDETNDMVAGDEAEPERVTTSDDVSESAKEGMLTHADIEWRLRPPREMPRKKKLSLKLASNVIRLDCLVKQQTPPVVLCPKGGEAMLEAYYKEPGKRKKQIARFGITTQRGPKSPEIDETIREIYNVELPITGAGVAAIIYMFVEPEFRGRGVGELALEAIAAIHTVQGCDFTVLVADDNGSGKLVEWYESNGFTRAPKLQKLMGSPDRVYGTTMIAPTSAPSDFFERCEIKWW